MILAQFVSTWEAQGLKSPRISVAFKDPAGSVECIVILYDEKRGVVTEAYRFGKRRRVVRNQQHFRDVAVAGIAAHALGVRPWIEIDL